MPVAIITGASKGLGPEPAAAPPGRGWDLVVDARSAGPLEAAARELRGTGARVVAPLGLVQEALPLLRAASDSSRSPDSSFTSHSDGNASLSPYVGESDAEGSGVEGSAAERSSTALPDTDEPGNHDSSLKGNVPPYIGIGGAILSISSDAAVEAYPTAGGYGATKAAPEQQSAVPAEEEPGLRVWWVDPGDMRTDLYAAAVPLDDGSGRPLPATAVPAPLRLLDERPAGGRCTAAEPRDGAR